MWRSQEGILYGICSAFLGGLEFSGCCFIGALCHTSIPLSILSILLCCSYVYIIYKDCILYFIRGFSLCYKCVLINFRTYLLT